MSKTLSQSPKRIFIDATYTIGSGKSSGIERVVRNLLRECGTLGENGQLPVPQLVVSHAGKFFAVDQTHLDAFERTAAMQANVLNHTPNTYRAIAEGVCRLSSSGRLRKWLLPQPGHLGIFKLLHTHRELCILRKLSRSVEPVTPDANDLFLLPDAYWINRLRNTAWTAAEEARSTGAIVASVVYDLIPLTHPQFVGLKRRDAFADYLQKAAQHSDLLVAISRTVREQLIEYLESSRCVAPDAMPKIESFQLGAELQQSAEGSVRSSVKELFSREQTPYLMVATFDPRKNHKYLLDAFDKIWKSGAKSNLCLVGRIGSRCDDIIARIKNHPELGKQLHLFDNLTDVELQHCYRRARGVIFPSLVEGFGLPIVESLWFGKKTFVSSTPIHREVGGSDCCYFDLESPTSLVECISHWEKAIEAGEHHDLPTRKPTSWQESCNQIVAHCLDVFADRPGISPASKAA